MLDGPPIKLAVLSKPNNVWVASESRAVQRYLLKVIENMDLRPPRAAA